MNFKTIKSLTRKLFSETTNTTIGNLSYLFILALAPTIIITTSVLNILSNYIPFSDNYFFSKIYEISEILNLNETTNFFINLICINLLSSGIFCLLTIFEKTYHFQFKNYIRKKLYSLALSLILLLFILLIIFTTFFLTKYAFFQKADFIITLLSIFISILIFYKFSTFQKIKNLYVGALISSLFLTIFLNFFYYIISNFSNMRSYYGLLTPIIIAILLIYYSCYIVYLGVLLNVEFLKNKYKTM